MPLNYSACVRLWKETSSHRKQEKLQAFLETCGFAAEKLWGIHIEQCSLCLWYLQREKSSLQDSQKLSSKKECSKSFHSLVLWMFCRGVRVSDVCFVNFGWFLNYSKYILIIFIIVNIFYRKHSGIFQDLFSLMFFSLILHFSLNITWRKINHFLHKKISNFFYRRS